MTDTMVEATTITPLVGAEALDVQEVEYRRMVELLRSLDPEDWTRGTDCTLWTVTDMVAHLLGSARSSAFLETLRQGRISARDAKRTGQQMVDTLSALQVREHNHRSPTELTEGLAREGAKAVRRRRRLPGVIGRLRIVPMPFLGKSSVAYLVEVVLTRDIWMHRIDIARATGHQLVLTPEHDGRIVADVVRDLASHDPAPFTLHLTGPAGGTFSHGGGGQPVTIDAVEFCRALSGRTDRTGLPDAPVVF